MRFRNLVFCVLLLSSFVPTAFAQFAPTVTKDLRLLRTGDANGTYAFRHDANGILKGYNSANTQTSQLDSNTGFAELLEVRVGAQKRRLYGETGQLTVDGNFRSTGFLGAGVTPTQAFETMSNNPRLRMRNSNDGGFGSGAKSWAVGYNADTFGIYDNGASSATYTPRLTWVASSGTFYPKFSGSSATGTGLMVDGALTMSGSNTGSLGASVVVPSTGKFIARDSDLNTKAELSLTGLSLASGANIAVANGTINVAVGSVNVSSGNITAGGQIATGGNYLAPTGLEIPTGNVNVGTGNVSVSTGNIEIAHGNINVFDGGAAMDWLTVQNPARARVTLSQNWDEGTQVGSLWQFNLGDGIGTHDDEFVLLHNVDGTISPVTGWATDGTLFNYGNIRTDSTIYAYAGAFTGPTTFGDTISVSGSVAADYFVGDGTYIENVPKLDAVVNMFDGEIQVPYLVTPLAVIGGSTLSSSAVSFQPDEITLGSGYTASGFAGLHVMDNSANDWYFGFNDAEGAWLVDHGSGTLIAGSIAVGFGDRAYLSYDGSGNLSISDTLSGSPNFDMSGGTLFTTAIKMAGGNESGTATILAGQNSVEAKYFGANIPAGAVYVVGYASSNSNGGGLLGYTHSGFSLYINSQNNVSANTTVNWKRIQ